MTDVELLPLPSVLLNWPHPTNHAAIRDYARSNVAHATARLRAHRDRLTLHVLDLEADRSGLIGACDEYRQRAERLAEALRNVRAVGRDDDGDYAHKGEHHATCVAIAERALRDHDQETKK